MIDMHTNQKGNDMNLRDNPALPEGAKPGDKERCTKPDPGAPWRYKKGEVCTLFAYGRSLCVKRSTHKGQESFGLLGYGAEWELVT